jgi:VIT1/CCC1 family predicted Fe2+/Mn2+ transporter
MVVALASLAFLGVLGYFGARAGRAKPVKSVARVVFWGAVAMAITAGVGRLFGAVI